LEVVSVLFLLYTRQFPFSISLSVIYLSLHQAFDATTRLYFRQGALLAVTEWSLRDAGSCSAPEGWRLQLGWQDISSSSVVVQVRRGSVFTFSYSVSVSISVSLTFCLHLCFCVSGFVTVLIDVFLLFLALSGLFAFLFLFLKGVRTLSLSVSVSVSVLSIFFACAFF
jgi:hypothetical protein